ncbi:hypothetical protein EFT43_06785, partial [Leuconostoc falkenbergense]|nr:hypothetical protein [Leuconostoc falkenbergense]
LSFHNIKKLLYLIISDYALEIKRSGFSVYEQTKIIIALGIQTISYTTKHNLPFSWKHHLKKLIISLIIIID